MAMLTVEEGSLSDTAIKVSFVTPNSRGSDILSYEFVFEGADEVFYSGTELLGISIEV